MFDIKNILEPSSIEEAIKILHENNNFKIISGGTDVLIKLHHGDMEEIELLSLKNLKELDFIKVLENDTIEIGSTTCFTNIYRNKIIKDFIPALGQGAISMGGPQIRNMATIGGNVCNGAVSADSAPSLFAFNAKLRLRSFQGERIVPIEEFYEGPGKVNIRKDEILISILIEKKDYEGVRGTYIKYSNRKAMDISMLSVCVVASVKENKFKDLRIALGVAGPTPIRCRDAEKYALGLENSEENINNIAQYAVKSASARDSWRASKAYREHLIKELTVRGIYEVTK
ncbi:MAG: xanthine dehydrogenase FAD-binding subunit XdhB [Clostridium sulfidigenes]|uniref:Xanthine dehydrogenase FAD-binding subunit XdhB n=1 Tax=Clostridium sulfidigenes TaxID=318464 RepID=A0A927ZMG0_9CLOT|nr:xanthine dehydrogenase FAD-binding subunit XdhB [Clostridium sulfidigenes]